MITSKNPKSTVAQMLIKKPVAQVFNAFTDPEITRNFWFTKGSARLEMGKTVIWKWEMYGFSAPAYVVDIVENKKITIDWGKPPRRIDLDFQNVNDLATYVLITETGYAEEGDDLLNVINDSAGGFTTVLDGLKAWLEHGINLNLIADKFPMFSEAYQTK